MVCKELEQSVHMKGGFNFFAHKNQHDIVDITCTYTLHMHVDLDWRKWWQRP